MIIKLKNDEQFFILTFDSDFNCRSSYLASGSKRQEIIVLENKQLKIQYQVENKEIQDSMLELIFNELAKALEADDKHLDLSQNRLISLLPDFKAGNFNNDNYLKARTQKKERTSDLSR